MLKYECDECHKVNVPDDTYGPGVVPHLRPFVYTIDGVCLEITPHKGQPEDHICGACLGEAVWKLVEEVWPEAKACICEFITSGPLAGAVTYDEKCPALGHAGLARMTDEDVPGDSGSDSDVREVRAEPEMPKPDSLNSATPGICGSCGRGTAARPGRNCASPAFHIYAQF